MTDILKRINLLPLLNSGSIFVFIM